MDAINGPEQYDYIWNIIGFVVGNQCNNKTN